MALKWYILGPLIAIAGGVLGIAGAATEESKAGAYFALFGLAPIIEEVMKPCGVYLLAAKWPQALPSRKYTAFLAALAGLSFALIENAIYLQIYFPEHGRDLLVWRYTACLGIHTVCSFILGFGINQRLVASVKGEITFLKGNWPFFLAAIALHSAYNAAAFLLETRWGWFGG